MAHIDRLIPWITRYSTNRRLVMTIQILLLDKHGYSLIFMLPVRTSAYHFNYPSIAAIKNNGIVFYPLHLGLMSSTQVIYFKEIVFGSIPYSVIHHSLYIL